ncbi:acyl carrier protein [Chitinophaga pendula]|uniref:acyl carrier protein n=1 Tax=Chitinophaga TaxID=79328 RepID=UPI000BB068B7|nr:MULTISPECIES: acyl carrier protein [Chitinophaga]ASZ12884.1 acyl carrier protein [Chitinophaga sp. MD30]UCJ09487.1 acyl carrier protein [Chitinophaga pendula]
MEKEAIFQIIVKHTLEVIPELESHEFKITDQLKELGANSVDRADITTMTMETLELEVPLVELFGAQNIEDLVELFYAKKQ